jgi:predicted small secreted protein
VGIYSRYLVKTIYYEKMVKNKILIIVFLSLFLNTGCNTIAGTTKGVVKDVISIIPGV